MDPEACLQRAALLYADADLEGLNEALEDYQSWRRGGGFEPYVTGVPGDVLYERLITLVANDHQLLAEHEQSETKEEKP